MMDKASRFKKISVNNNGDLVTELPLDGSVSVPNDVVSGLVEMLKYLCQLLNVEFRSFHPAGMIQAIVLKAEQTVECLKSKTELLVKAENTIQKASNDYQRLTDLLLQKTSALTEANKIIAELDKELESFRKAKWDPFPSVEPEQWKVLPSPTVTDLERLKYEQLQKKYDQVYKGANWTQSDIAELQDELRKQGITKPRY